MTYLYSLPLLQETFRVFRSECRRRGLRIRERAVQPPSTGAGSSAGVMGRRSDYEGGFLMMALDHEAAPCLEWHSDDFTAVPP